MDRAFVSIGSNIDRERHIGRALALLRERFGDLQLSSVYESDAVGFVGEPFFNLVAAFDTDSAPAAIVQALREIEERCGRERGDDRFGPRTMDIDLLMVGDRVVHDGDVAIPRDEVRTQAFVLGPLAEIAGSRIHPVTGQSLESMWNRLEGGEESLRRVSVDGELTGSVES